MVPGIDPKIDIAFKKVFGSQAFRDLTASLINAVLQPPPEHRVVHVELPKFRKTPAELQTPLDFWLYFLNNGAQLDADAFPPELDRSEVC